MYFMGLDVGYSNLKVAGGAARNMTIHERLPAGAGPAADLDESLGGNQTSGVDVDVRGQSWVAGVEPSGFASPREKSIPTTRRLVHADAECADRSVVIETGVRAMPVIVMQPVRQMRRALIRILVGAGIRPLVERRLDQPLGLAVGARTVRPRSPVFEPESATHLGEHA